MQKSSEAFRTISEVSRDLNIPKHVLRFWEGKFPQLKPMKRGGGRRYYRLKDIDLLRGIQRLLYYDGYHIRGVQKILRKNGVDYVKTYWQHEEERHHQPDLADIPDLVAHVTDHLGSSFKGQNLQVTGEEDHPQISTSPLLDVKSTEGLSHLLQELETCHKLLVQSSK